MKKLFKTGVYNLAVLAFIVSGFSSPAALSQEMEEIIVTAAKREQTLQETPIAVSVVSQEAIQQTQVVNLSDLQALVPSLRVNTFTRASDVNFSIRGFGNGGSAVGTEPAVGVFIDGVYRSRPTSTMLDLPRLERVEVLRGPQSTLFGKNASAGVINIVTPEPSHDADGMLEATIGRFNTRMLKGYYTGSVTDDVAVSFSANVNHRDGFANAPEGIKDLNDKNRWAARFQALYEPNESSKFRLIADYSEVDESCCITGNIISGGTAGIIQALGGQVRVASEDNFTYDAFINFNQENPITDWGLSLNADIEYEGFTLSSITAYRDNKRGPQFGDIDYTSADLASAESVRLRDSWSQELRLTSATEGRVDWMVGAFVFSEDYDSSSCTYYGEDLREYAFALTGGTLAGTGGALGLIEGILGTPGAIFNSNIRACADSGQDNDALSLFGTLDFAATDAVTLSLGLNYTSDEKQVYIRNTENTDTFSALDLTTFAGGALAALRGLQFRPPGLDLPNVVEDGRSDDSDTTWLARVSWDVNDTWNMYASVATGFKSSGWNGGTPARTDQEAVEAAGIATSNQQYGGRVANPEYATVYEIGIKGNFDRGYAYLTLFDQKIEDFQTRGFDGVNFIDTNAGELRSEGVEVDLLYMPTDNLRLSLSSTYLDPIYEDYQDAPGPLGGPRLVDRSGTRPGGIHDLSTVGSVTYTFAVENGRSGFARVDYLYEKDTGLSDSFPEISREVKSVNASAGINFKNGVTARIWGRNLTDEQYFTGGFNGVAQPGTVNSFLSEPKTYGLTVGYNF